MPDDGQLRFVAVKYSVWPLDGRRFATAEEALRAVAALHVLRQRGPIGTRAAPTDHCEAVGTAGAH
jgi:hypothetical protein